MGAGHVETVRYECSFGFNNHGTMFENGIYKGDEENEAFFVNTVADKLVKQLDKDIKAIEKCSNKTLAAKWIVYKDSGNPEQTCVHLSLSSASCWDMELGDSGVPSCEFCWLASEIDCWYEIGELPS